MNFSSEIEQILKQQNQNGGSFWSREDGDIHAPHGSSTMDTFFVLGELGASVEKYPILRKVIEFIYSYQTDDGSFKYSCNSSKLPCITARILAALGRVQADKNFSLEKSYQHLLKLQKPDGGWRCNTVKVGKSPITDASNPGTTLYVLDAFRFRKNSQQDMIQLAKGVDFLTQHWEVRQPIGPCAFGIGSRFMQIEYPFLRYNLFYYVYVLSFYHSAIYDNRFLEAFDILKSKVTKHGIVPENPHRLWQKFSFAQKNKVSTLATERWNEIKDNLNLDV